MVAKDLLRQATTDDDFAQVCLLAEAQAQGFAEVRLETVSFMTDAIRLYRAFGFAACPAYCESPASLKPITVFMVCTL